MIPVKTMPIIITAILVVCGYLALIQAVNSYARQSIRTMGNLILIDGIIAVMYGAVCVVSGVLYAYSGYHFAVIFVILAAGACILFLLFLRFCWKQRESMKKGRMFLLFLYFGVLFYVTVFMRIGYGDGLDTSISVTPFDDLMQAVAKKDPRMLKHMVLNIALFLPFGYLIPAMNPEKLMKCSYVFLGGLVCSTVIEGAQMVFRLGQSDIDDIIANTIGAAAGYVLARMVWQIQKNWKV